MSSHPINVETHGAAFIPKTGVLVVPNRLSFAALLHLEKMIQPRRIVYLIEKALDYDPLLQAHLDKDEVEALEFCVSETEMESFKRALHGHLAAGSLVVFVPGVARLRPGQVVTVPTVVLKFLTSNGAPLLPLYVDHPEESSLGVESPRDIERIVLSFGQPLQREAANLANFWENLLIAGEVAYSARPIFQSHLAYEVLRGLKRRSKSAGIIDGFDGTALRFDKLLAAGIVLAKELRKRTEHKRVGIVLPPGKGGLLCNLAVLLAGKIPVNLNFTASDQAIASCIEQAKLDLFLTATPFVEKLASFPWPPAQQLLLLDQTLPKLKLRIAWWLLITKFLSAESLTAMLHLPKKGGDQEAVLLFTSGSSGLPKGVPLSHRNLLANINQFGARVDLKSDDKILGCLPLFHSFGSTVTIWYPFIEGVTVVTYPSPLEVAKLAELIEEHSISLLIATPTFLRGYLRKATKEQFASLKLIVTGAEKLPEKLAETFYKRFEKPVLEGYGLTETSPATNVNLPDPECPPGDHCPTIPNRRLGTVGLFLPGIAVKITAPETHEPLSVFHSGMIWLKGANVFRGYLNQPEKSALVLQNDWFMTGDIGRLDEDGFLHIEGRLSRFSKIGGEMVPHETVEDAITKALGHKDDKRLIAIVGIPDEAKGEALVLLSADPKLDIQILRGKLLDSGMPALWVPKKVQPVDAIPILASGKLDLKGCQDLVASNPEE
jgi:acyl-[acyl-carrier-protein]-phospholipid O-acyltransferase / long-chain-fatty-acid--[acyl-carrier-protein] ligase